ncbi:hypothetical protein [Hansschlegelia zhihuaiae]|uniref:DUF3034 family protein n=1 Tax=Hansschlegelia zhihuaiae TaxID=405005 RepID=A0A4Q0MNX0_9HYPH|nr:hypothetical protein [Hansschlegelia zhihuaiae]RXF74819.1 hypothetical protein EK403_04530 [Hansschlegelia zhihuaiae]
MTLLALLGTAAAPHAAAAGAFTLERGEVKAFLTGYVMSGDEYFDRMGKRQSRGRYEKRELQAFVEYGALEGLTLFGSTALQRIEAKDGGVHDREGLGRSEAGARARLWSQDGWIVSAQASAVIAGAKKGSGLAAIGETDDQADVRGLVARSFEVFGKPAFLDMGVGYRWRSGDPANEMRIDVTLGIRPIERLLLLVQNFNQIGTGRWKGPYELKQRIHKLQGAAIFDLNERWSIFAAAFFTPVGQDCLDERGATVGIGLRF